MAKKRGLRRDLSQIWNSKSNIGNRVLCGSSAMDHLA